MEQQNTGNNVSEKLQGIEKALDEYEDQIGLIRPVKVDAAHYFSLSDSDLSKMSNEDCAEAAYQLSRYSFYVQQQINKEKAILNWCEKEIMRSISNELELDRFTKYEPAYMNRVKQNSYASRLLHYVSKSKARLDRLEFLPQKIDKMADKFSNLQFLKRDK